MDGSVSCEFCSTTYTRRSSLSRHYTQFPTHRRPKVNTDKCVETFLNVNPYFRKARLKKLAQNLSFVEVFDSFAPKICQTVSLLEYLEFSCKSKIRVCILRSCYETRPCFDARTAKKLLDSKQNGIQPREMVSDSSAPKTCSSCSALLN